jgi:hypothetical protein
MDQQNVRRTYDRMARIGITHGGRAPSTFGAGRMPRFLQELVEQHQS